MKKIFKITFFTLCLLVFSMSAFGQTPETIEKELIGLYGKVNDNSAYSGDNDSDLLGKANEDFKSKILQYTKFAPTLKYKFTELEKEITISTSDDGKLRVYSWDTLSGGTMHFYETVYQFRGADGAIYSESVETEEGDSGSFVQKIFTADTKSGKIYLINGSSTGSTQDRFQSLSLFRIKGNVLDKNVKLIKTRSGLTNSISFAYNFFSTADNPGNFVLFTFDKNTKTFKFPVVVNDKEFPNGRVTDKLVSYKFDGTYFVKVK